VGWRTLDVRDDTRRTRSGRDGAPAAAVRMLAVQLWYPAKPGGQPVTYLDYARSGAPRVDGSFPLAIWIGGTAGPRAVAPLAEALASHGWVASTRATTTTHRGA
jgi:hypothetical protein